MSNQKRSIRFTMAQCTEDVYQKIKLELTSDSATRIIEDLANEALYFEKKAHRPQSLIKTLTYLILKREGDRRPSLSKSNLMSDAPDKNAPSKEKIDEVIEAAHSEIPETPVKKEILAKEQDPQEKSSVEVDSNALQLGSLSSMFSAEGDD